MQIDRLSVVQYVYDGKGAAFAAYRCDDGEGSDEETDDPERENEASGDENESQSHYH